MPPDARRRFFLPLPLYSVLKRLYVSTLKPREERRRLRRLPGKRILVLQASVGETFLFANLLLSQGIGPDLPFDHVLFLKPGPKQVFDLYFRGYASAMYGGRVLQNIEQTRCRLDGKDILFFLGQDFWRPFAAGNRHIVPAILDVMGVAPSRFRFHPPRFASGGPAEAADLLKRLGIDPENFIYLNTAASSMSPLRQEGLLKLIDGIRGLGYDVFINTRNVDEYISLEQSFRIAALARQIVSLRSGFTELLATHGKRTHVIYTQGSIPNFRLHYSLNGYPIPGLDVLEYSDTPGDMDALLDNIGR